MGFFGSRRTGHAEGNAILTSRASCCQILSRDSVTVSVDAVVYFNVIDAEQALCSVDDFRLDRRTDGTIGPSVRRKSATSVCTLVPWDRLRRRQSAWGGWLAPLNRFAPIIPLCLTDYTNQGCGY